MAKMQCAIYMDIDESFVAKYILSWRGHWMNVLEIEYNVQGKMEHNHVKSDEAKFDGCNVK